MNHTKLVERIQRLDELYLAWDKKLREHDRAKWRKKKARLLAEADQLWAAYRDLRDAWNPADFE